MYHEMSKEEKEATKVAKGIVCVHPAFQIDACLHGQSQLQG